VRKVSGIVRDMLKEKGFQSAEVTPEIVTMPGGPKLVHLTFHMSEGPKVKIKRIVFTGNKVMSGSTLQKRIKSNKPVWMFSFINGRGVFQETKFDEDADKITEYYRDRGYIRANVGVPEQKFLSDSDDKKTRWIELRIPIVEGNRYKIGTVDFTGNTVVKTEFLKPIFRLTPGEYYNEKNVRKGMESAREIYGRGGYWEFTGFPDYKFRDDPNPADPQIPQALAAPVAPGPAIVDVTLRLQEGMQYFVNRITFVGNSTTHDTVIRRQMRLVEDGVFDTQALKSSVKLLNQLGYFKPLEEGKGAIDVAKTPNETNKVDVRLKLEEQNRNQLTFGAGVSQFEGFFGQLSFQTSNFLGRGESLTVSLQAGSLAQNYTLGFTEPFLFDRNMTGGVQLFRNDIHYINQFTQRTTGVTLTVGAPVSNFTRMFANYSYQRVRVTDINSVYTDPTILQRNPFLQDSLLIGQGGERTISQVTPSIVHNTVDNPIFPTSGKRYTASIALAGLGGNTNFYKPTLEGVWFWKQNPRMSLGAHANVEYIHQMSGSLPLPIFERLFLGGEYSVRGFDIRTIGPQDPVTGVVLGGNKSLLFNLEQSFAIAGPVRAILFYDAGQVRPQGQSFGWWEPVLQLAHPPGVILTDPNQPIGLVDPKAPLPEFLTIGQQAAFKTSTGVEIRFFMPVLNVPFRLIFYMDPQRAGVRDSNLQPQQEYGFRFAVGSTF
jgi:outer membrane protein insertion porin family